MQDFMQLREPVAGIGNGLPVWVAVPVSEIPQSSLMAMQKEKVRKYHLYVFD
jgi:hypothetical protein